jgi:predicted ATPase
MPHLQQITLPQHRPHPDAFPFTIPIIRHLRTLTLSTPVTFLVGENGSGKSTLLEALAGAVGSITVGSTEVARDDTLAHLRPLIDALKLTWSKRTRRGFFMRSEDFFGYARRMAQQRLEMQQELKRVEEEYKDASEFTKGQARMAFAGQLHGIEGKYGEGLDAQSHGESYFKLFQARFVPGGLYLLDEPEAPLSPLRQLSFLSMMKEMVEQNAQFIIATHSPIIMAYPGATILSCDGDAIAPVEYDELEHVTITRDFLNNPAAFLGHLLG